MPAYKQKIGQWPTFKVVPKRKCILLSSSYPPCLYTLFPKDPELLGVTANARFECLMSEKKIKQKQKQKSHHKLQIKGSAKPLLL